MATYNAKIFEIKIINKECIYYRKFNKKTLRNVLTFAKSCSIIQNVPIKKMGCKMRLKAFKNQVKFDF